MVEKIGHCKDCEYCRDIEHAKKVGCSIDCDYVKYCDPIGGTNYFRRKK